MLDRSGREAHIALVGDGHRSYHETSTDGRTAHLVCGTHRLHRHHLHVRYLRHALRLEYLLFLFLFSVLLTRKVILILAHHLFAVWNGDRRLQEKYGDRAAIIRERTSVVPFAAILSGKQQLPENYLQEFFRLPYFTIVAGSVVAYYAHPFMQAGAALMKW